MRISDWRSDVCSSDLPARFRARRGRLTVRTRRHTDNSRPARGSGGRVSMKYCLVVDDSKVVRMVARRILERLDFEIVEAADGALALEACGRQLPAAGLRDCTMTAETGRTFLRQERPM